MFLVLIIQEKEIKIGIKNHKKKAILVIFWDSIERWFLGLERC